MSEREQFEKWITSSPFEKSIKRNPEGIRSSWPGQYQHIDVQLAWEAWQDRANIAEQRIRELEQIANEAIDTIEDMAGGPCYPSLEYRKRLEQSYE